MFKTLKNALKTPEVRKKLLYTLLLIVVFRFGCYITVPGVDVIALNESMQQSTVSLTGLIDTISGGAFSRLSIFAMSISPYITAQIVVQLLSMIIPSLEALTKDGGPEAKAKINKYTKILCLILSLVEGLGIYFSYSSSGIFINPGFLTGFIVVMSLVAGTSMLIWLGEQITKSGIENGISMLIFVGIVSGFPGLVTTLKGLMFTATGFSTKGLLLAIAIIVGAIALIAAVVFIQEAERRIPVQYAKKVVGRKMYGGQSTHIPVKLAMAGVMPIIFASSFMTFPAMLIQIFGKSALEAQKGFIYGLYQFSVATSSSQVPWQYSLANAVVYFVLIVLFTYFYTTLVFSPAEISNNIKQNGGFIPGIRTGKPTTEYLESVINKLTLVGGICLSFIAIIPMLLRFSNLNISFGGTTILIVVGVALEMMRQLESQLVMRHYKGFLEK